MAAEGSRVTVYAKSTSVSAIPVRPGKTFPFSVLDHAMGRHTLHLVFYYRPGPTLDRDRLKDSLTEMLTHYPSVTGRLTRSEGGEWAVKCNDAGVRVLDARARVTLNEWMTSASAAEEMELAHWEPLGEDPSIWSPFYIQITEFEDKGYAIGLSCTHMHADPTCAALLIKAWSDAHRRSAIAHPPFFHPPALQNPNPPPPSAPLLSLKSTLTTPPSSAPKMSSATFRFPAAAVRLLLAEVNDPDKANATPFDALAGLFWHRVAGAQSALTVCVDFRKLLHASLPHGYYGNALHFSAVPASPGVDWTHAAQMVARHVAAEGEGEWWAAAAWLAARRGEGAFQMYGPELTCVRADEGLAYGAAFEAAPAHVTVRVGGGEGEGVVVVMASAEGGEGRTVGVTLPEEATARICRDDEILRLGATVMFSKS